MRKKDIQFEMINAEIMDRRTGRATVATIAFSLSYKGKDPAKVQQVANVLASLYLEENLRSREQQAKGASRFLEEELKLVKEGLSELDAKIAPFKEKNINALPELLQVNFQTLERIEYDIGRLNDELRSYKDKEGYLQTQLATTPTDMANQDRALLNELKARLVQLKSRFSDDYPDVIKTKREIAELEKRLNALPTRKDVLSNKVAEQEIDRPDNPAYITLAAQLASTQADIESIKRQILELRSRKEIYRRNIEASPRVEEKFKTLIAERSNMQNKYDDLMRKLMESRVSHGLEKELMAERFTLIDPARFPEKPIMPNVPVFLLIGTFLGFGAGVGALALREMNDMSVRSAEDLAPITTIPVLAAIPRIVVWKEMVRRRTVRRFVIIGTVLSLIAIILIFHFFIMDLDIFWIKVSKRLML
jgi:polysaccharide chain length determinant protein (PEP-CTERM system associated)